MWRCVELGLTAVSEERIASIFRVEWSASGEQVWAAGCRQFVHRSSYSSLYRLCRTACLNSEVNFWNTNLTGKRQDSLEQGSDHRKVSACTRQHKDRKNEYIDRCAELDSNPWLQRAGEDSAHLRPCGYCGCHRISFQLNSRILMGTMDNERNMAGGGGGNQFFKREATKNLHGKCLIVTRPSLPAKTKKTAVCNGNYFTSYFMQTFCTKSNFWENVKLHLNLVTHWMDMDQYQSRQAGWDVDIQHQTPPEATKPKAAGQWITLLLLYLWSPRWSDLGP
jgi:hypothetical protein